MHAGGSSGWVGDPLVFEANSGGGDFRENMTASLFEEYMEKLCQHCRKKRIMKVVFCMDNAKYHRREYQYLGAIEGASHKTLSQLNKIELIRRLVRQGADEDTLQGLKKSEPYEKAKRPECQVPLAVEEITCRFAVLFLSILFI